MSEPGRQELEHQVTGSIVVQLEPYRERRRTRMRGLVLDGFLVGFLIGAYLTPSLAGWLEAWLVHTSEPSSNGDRAGEHIAAYTDEDR